MPTFIYLLNKVIRVNLSFNYILKLFDEDPLGPLNEIRELLDLEIGKIRRVIAYVTYFNPEDLSSLIEYFLISDFGRVGVKIICSENLGKTLVEYHRAEKEGRVKIERLY